MKETIVLVWKDIKKYGLGVALAVLTFVIFDVLFGQICPGRIFFGLPCPACGMTRAFFLLIQGRVKESISMHPLLLPFLVWVLYCTIVKYLLKKSLQNIKIHSIIGLFLLLLVYIWRMCQYFPEMEPMTYYKDNFLHGVLEILRHCRRG